VSNVKMKFYDISIAVRFQLVERYESSDPIYLNLIPIHWNVQYWTL